jgi:hypothetical protein
MPVDMVMEPSLETLLLRAEPENLRKFKANHQIQLKFNQYVQTFDIRHHRSLKEYLRGAREGGSRASEGNESASGELHDFLYCFIKLATRKI